MKKINEETRQLILKSARELITTQGIKKLNMRSIAVKSNIGLGTIYNYYKSKNDIIIEIVHNIHKEIFVNLKEGILLEEDTYKKLELVFYSLRQFMTELREMSINEVFSLLVKSAPYNIEEMHKESAGRIEQLKQIFRDILNENDEFDIETITMLYILHAENIDTKYSQLEKFIKRIRMEDEDVSCTRVS